MDESKYLLTYDFKILYCPTIKLKLSTKELDLESLKFVKYNGNLNVIEYFFEINTDIINDILGNVLNCKFGYELSESDMEWILKIEKAIELNKNIYKNNNLMFNYYILKLRLAGFKEELAIQFTKNYFYVLNKKNENDNLTSIEESISILNKIIQSKEVWIGNKMYDYANLEEEFLRTVFKYKRKLLYQFNFDMFKQDYLNIIQNSFISYIYEYNKIKSYLVRNTKIILDNEPYKDILLDIYKRILWSIIQYLIENEEYYDLANDDYKFINNLVKDMSDCVKMYLTILEDSLK